MNKQEIDYSLRCLASLKEELKLSNAVPDHDYLSAIETAISALTQQLNNGWISASERLPEINKDVQVTFREYMDWNKKYRHGTCKAIYIAEHSIKSEDMGWYECEGCEVYDEAEDVYYVKSGWYEVIENWPDYTHVYINCEVTAWRSLPEPYKEIPDDRSN